MKKSWHLGLALSLGLVGTTDSLAQYPNNYNNFGPSSYPVQTQAEMRSVLQNVPQVPNGYSTQPTYASQPNYANQAVQFQGGPYQLVNAQDPTAIYSQPAQEAVTLPAEQYSAPMAPSNMSQVYASPPGCQTCAPSAPMMEYSNQEPIYQQSVAPNCSSCGPAPVSMGYVPFQNGGYFNGGNFGGNIGVGGGQLAALPPSAQPWFFGASGLLFNRVDDRNIPLSFADTAYSPDVITTRDARMPVTGGFEAMLGRYFNCGKNAIQASYWGLFPTDQTVLRSAAAGAYRTRIPFAFMTMPGPALVYNWFDDAWAHQLTRTSTYNNVEVNLLGFAVGSSARSFNMPTAGTMFAGLGGQTGSCGYCGGAGCSNCAGTCGYGAQSKYAAGPCCLTAPRCGSRLNLTWLGGFRYFRFTDNLLYAASLNDGVINQSADDMYYEVNTTNDLYGAQFGSRADYCIGQRWNAYISGKVGVYNNHSRLFTRLGTSVSDAYPAGTPLPANPFDGQAYRFDVTKNDIAFLSELASGIGFRMSPRWTATVGYRAVIASGVANSVDNIRQTFVNYNDVRDFHNRSALILHGANFGALYNF